MGIPNFRENKWILDGNISYFEKTFIQEFKIIYEEKCIFWVLVNAIGDFTDMLFLANQSFEITNLGSARYENLYSKKNDKDTSQNKDISQK